MKEQEEIILTNSVGTITSQVVKIKPAKGKPLTLRLTDIVGIKHQLKRKFHYAALFLVFGLGALFTILFPVGGGQPSIASYLVPVVLIIAGIANLIGYYIIEIETPKGPIRLEDVEFTKLKQGKIFIETLEKLIADQKTASA